MQHTPLLRLLTKIIMTVLTQSYDWLYYQSKWCSLFPGSDFFPHLLQVAVLDNAVKSLSAYLGIRNICIWSYASGLKKTS